MRQLTPRANILVVEDNDDVREILAVYLRNAGYAITEAVDGAQALAVASERPPDMILLDVLLPRLDGIEVLKRLRQTPTGARVPVVMMSAVLQSKDLQHETQRLGVLDFLQKPFQVRRVLEVVESALQRATVPPVEPTPAAPTTRSRTTGGNRLQYERQTLRHSGNIEDTSLPELLHSVFVGSQTGKLQLIAGTTEKTIYFQNGMPVYAESSLPGETLGAHLLSRGRIAQAQHDAAIEEMTNSGRHFGEVLLKLGVLGPHDLFTELEAHLMSKVIGTFAWFSGTFAFTEGMSWKDDVIVARMQPGRILLDGIHQHWTAGTIYETLGITDHCRAYPLESTPYSPEQMGLSTQETRIAQLVRRKPPLGEIIRQIGDVNLVATTVYALYIMEALGFTIELGPATEADRTSVAPAPASSRPGMEEHAKALLAEYLKFRTADYFKLLGVTRGATQEEIDSAFAVRKRRYSPETLVGIDTGLVHEKIEELYVRLHEAYRTLSNPDARRRYIDKIELADERSPRSERMKSGPVATPKKKDNHVQLFEQGFSCLRSGDFAGAKRLFEEAWQAKQEPRYQAYTSWADYLSDPVNAVGDTAKTLKQLHKDKPQDALYPYLLGNLALREKDPDRAIVYFETALRLDPQHIESARQLRILRMRQRNTEGSGLFELFKKK